MRDKYGIALPVVYYTSHWPAPDKPIKTEHWVHQEVSLDDVA